MEGLDKLNLAERTRNRNISVWVNLDWGGLLSPLDDQQEALNLLGSGAIENYLAISNEAWAIKEYQRDQGDELDRVEVTQARELADAKVATEREKLALKTTTDDYVLAVRVYDAKVRALLMGAREYAALVEREQLVVDESRAILAVSKEELRQTQINAQIYYEAIQKAQVEADLARAQVDVAKAHVRALMADIEAGRAEIELVEAQVQKYVAMAEKATLQADVATIYAEIVTKKLSAIKLDVGRQEIENGFTYIQTKLDDMLAIWETRTLAETIKAEAEVILQDEVALNLFADKAQEDLREADADQSRIAFEYEESKTETNLAAEAAVRDGLVAARKTLNDARLLLTTSRDDKQSWAQALINVAHKYAYLHGLKEQSVTTSSVERISS